MTKERTIPVRLAECVTTLYKADGALNPLTDQAVWIGQRTENLEIDDKIAMVTSTPSGVFFEEEEQLGLSHTIGFDRIWALNPAGAGAGRDFVLERGKYALVIYTESRRHRYWKKWTFYGVTAQINSRKAQGQTSFAQRQFFGARYFFMEEGRLASTAPGAGGGTNPVLPALSTGTGTTLTEQCLPFMHLGPMPVNDYFQGQYVFTDRSVQVVWAKAYAKASQTTATQLGLEVNGVMSAVTLTLPIGAVNVEVNVGGVVTPALVIAQGAVMRWKVIGAPAAAEDMGHSASVNMNVQ